MRKLVMVSLVLGLNAGVAAADPTTRMTLGDGYELAVDQGGVSVIKGKQRARLAEGISITKAALDKKTRKVDATIEDYTCESTHQYSWTTAYLDARLENTAAYALHRKKDYKGSAAGFAKAVAADPTWKIPAYNLASAQQLVGDKDAATKTLAPWIASEPVPTYLQVSTDPELSPLLERPELKALRAKKAGNAKVSADSLAELSYSPDHKLLSVTRMESSWGACTYTVQLELYDLTGKLVTSTPVVKWDETSPDCAEDGGEGVLERARKGVAARTKTLQKMLRDLGFSTIKSEKALPIASTGGTDDRRSVKSAKLEIIADGGAVRVMRKTDEVAKTTVLDHMNEVLYVPSLSVLVVKSSRAGAEGCEGSDPTQVTIVPVKP